VLVVALLGRINVVYASDDVFGDVWAIFENILPFLLSSPLIFILLFKFWGQPLLNVALKLKWVLIMVLPTAIYYGAMPEIANYAVIDVPYWYFYISPPLVVDCIIGYSLAVGNSFYFQFGILWLLCIYAISFFLVGFSKKDKKSGEKKKRNVLKIVITPFLVWIIFVLWGFLMMNTHLLFFDWFVSFIGSWGGIAIVVGVCIVIAILVVWWVRKKPKEVVGKKLLYCKEMEGGKMVCVYDLGKGNNGNTVNEKQEIKK
jgi:hypothetical protein